MNKFLAYVLSSFLILSSNSVVHADRLEVAEQSNDGYEQIIPFDNYLIINNVSINTNGNIWSQPAGYNEYRVSVSNTRSEDMTVIVKYNSRKNNHTFTVEANCSNTITVNNSAAGRHTTDYTTKNGSVSGEVSVKVADHNL